MNDLVTFSNRPDEVRSNYIGLTQSMKQKSSITCLYDLSSFAFVSQIRLRVKVDMDLTLSHFPISTDITNLNIAPSHSKAVLLFTYFFSWFEIYKKTDILVNIRLESIYWWGSFFNTSWREYLTMTRSVLQCAYSWVTALVSEWTSRMASIRPVRHYSSLWSQQKSCTCRRWPWTFSPCGWYRPNSVRMDETAAPISMKLNLNLG